MKILLLGNIGSGKTSIATEISKLHPECEYLAVDDFRRVFGDGTMKGDSTAKSAFIRSITHDNHLQLIECTGFGRLGSSLYRRLQKYEGKLATIVLDAPLDTCLERVSSRTWDIPFPTDTTRGEDLVKKLYKHYSSSQLFERWGLWKNATFIRISNKNQEDFKVIVNIISSFIKGVSK